MKDWHKFQHYAKRRPPWIKSYAAVLLDDRFLELSDAEQGQLMKLWLVASQSSRFTTDVVANKVVPVIVNDERKLRVAIRSTRRIPLEKFILDGWLIRVRESELVDEVTERAVLHALFGDDSDSGVLAAC